MFLIFIEIIVWRLVFIVFIVIIIINVIVIIIRILIGFIIISVKCLLLNMCNMYLVDDLYYLIFVCIEVINLFCFEKL